MSASALSSTPARWRSRDEIVIGQQGRSAVGVVNDRDLEPDDGRGYAAADVPLHERLAQLDLESLRRIDPAVDAGDDVEVQPREERCRHVLADARAGERLVAVKKRSDVRHSWTPLPSLMRAGALRCSDTGRLRPAAGLAGGFGSVCLVGIEGTGSNGAGLARRVAAAGIQVVEVDRSDRQDRRSDWSSQRPERLGEPGEHDARVASGIAVMTALSRRAGVAR